MKTLKIIFTIFILYTLYYILYTPKINASGLSLGVYPPVIQIQANPPETISEPLHIVNNGDTPVTLALFLKPFTGSSENDGEPLYTMQKEFFSQDTTGFLQHVSLVNDAGDTITQVSLSPKQTKTLMLTIDIPQDQNSSDNYFSVFFINSQSIASKSDTSVLAGGIAMHVLLSIGPKQIPSGYIKTFSSPLFVEEGPVPFTIEVVNNSSHYISTKGVITIKNMFGQEIGNVGLLPTDILSHNSRFIPDEKDIMSTQALWPEKILFGPYTAKVTIALSDQGPVLTKTTQFFALPIQAIIGCFCAIIIIISIGIRVKRRVQ